MTPVSSTDAQLQPEDEHQCLVDGAELVRFEAAGRPPEPLRVHHRRLLDDDARLLALEPDRRPEARRARARGCGGDEDGAEAEKFVCLDDHCVAGASLFVPARTSRCRKPKDLAANHSVCWSRRELRELFADDPHFLAVVPIRCQPPHFVANGGAQPAACRCLAQCRSHSFRVRQMSGADNVEGCGR